MDQIIETSLLYDFYGSLLSDRKRQVMELYHEEDMSLSEIAEEFGISRAAVHDSLKSAEKNLKEYEEKLGFLKIFLQREEAIEKIETLIDKIEAENKDQVIAEELKTMRDIIGSLD